MNKFLLTINQTIDAFRRPHGGGPQRRTDNTNQSISKVEALTRILLTFVLIFIALYLLRFNTQSNSYSEIASTIIGAIVGYWFR